jgi:hypothetical protein
MLLLTALPIASGFFLHFDLSSPSPSVPLSFFPVNASYGYSDFGSWIVDFERVSCERWAGWGNQSVRLVVSLARRSEPDSPDGGSFPSYNRHLDWIPA